MRRKGARSVLPDGEKIDSLRRERGWTIEDFAEGAEFSSRTAQTAIAGKGVDVTTLSAIAKRLGVSYDSLLLKPTGSPSTISSGSMNDAGEKVLRLEISLGPESASTDKNSLVIAVLESLRGKLPDNARITFLGVSGMTAIVAVTFTPSNALALSEILDEIGIEKIRATDRRTVEDSPFVGGAVGRIAQWIRAGMQGENPVAYSPIGGYALDREIRGRGRFHLDAHPVASENKGMEDEVVKFLSTVLPDNHGISVLGLTGGDLIRFLVPMTSRNELILSVMGVAMMERLGWRPNFIWYQFDDDYNPNVYCLCYKNKPKAGRPVNPSDVLELSYWRKIDGITKSQKVQSPRAIVSIINDLVENGGYLMRRSSLTERDIVDDRHMQYVFGVPYKGTYYQTSWGSDYGWLCELLGLRGFDRYSVSGIPEAIRPITDAILEYVGKADPPTD